MRAAAAWRYPVPHADQEETMATNYFEIPTEMRTMAEKSVEQAKAAFDTFMTAAHRTVSTWEGQVASTQKNAKDVADKALSFAEQNVTASFDHAQNLLRARDVEEVTRLHAQFVQEQITALQRQLQDLTGKAAGGRTT
jgi:phasin